MKQSFITKAVLLLLLCGTSLTAATHSFAQDAPPTDSPPAAAPPAAPLPLPPDVPPVAPPPVTPPPTIPAPDTAPAATGDASKIKEATIAYNNGVAALKKNDLAGAATQFEQAVALAPKDAKAQMFLGYVRLKQERYPEALAALQAAQAQGTGLDAKETAQLNNNIGNVHWKQERQTEAIAAFQKAVAGDPEYMDARYNLAFALFARKNYTEALPHFTVLLAKTPPDPALDMAAVYDARGAVYEKSAQWSKAVGDYRKAAELDKKEPSYPFNLSLAMLNSGRLSDAIAPLQEVIRRDARHEQAHLLLGDIYIKQKSWKKAQQALQSYVALRPDEFAGQFNLGVSYDYAGQFAEALRAYAEAERMKPLDPNVKNNVGRIYFKQKKFGDAIAKLQDALQLNPNFYDARHNLALVLTAQGDLEKANREWRLLIDGLGREALGTTDKRRKAALQARVAAVRGALSDNYLRTEEYALAIAEYNKLLLFAPDNIDARSNLGLAFYHTKAYDSASKAYLEVIKRDPKNAIAHNNLGVVLEALGKRGEALARYRQAIKLKPDYTEAKVNLERLLARTSVS